VKVWATQAGDGTTRLTLINDDTLNDHDVAVQVPGATTVGQEESLQAPSAASTSGVTLGGESFGDETTSGTLPPPATSPVAPSGDTYTVSLPAASAAMVTIPPGAGSAPGSSGSGGGGITLP
jgi:hypothetical protein